MKSAHIAEQAAKSYDKGMTISLSFIATATTMASVGRK